MRRATRRRSTAAQLKLYLQKWRYYERNERLSRKLRLRWHFLRRDAYLRFPVQGNLLEALDERAYACGHAAQEDLGEARVESERRPNRVTRDHNAFDIGGGNGNPNWGGWDNGYNIYCASDDGRRTICPTDTRGGVQLARKRSDASCDYGRDWGYNHRGIWVDRGCRADFRIGGGGNGGGGGWQRGDHRR